MERAVSQLAASTFFAAWTVPALQRLYFQLHLRKLPAGLEAAPPTSRTALPSARLTGAVHPSGRPLARCVRMWEGACRRALRPNLLLGLSSPRRLHPGDVLYSQGEKAECHGCV